MTPQQSSTLLSRCLDDAGAKGRQSWPCLCTDAPVLKRRLLRPTELRLHRPPGLCRVVTGVDLDITPADHRAVGDIVPQLHLMREADRQRTGLEGCGRWHQLPPNGVAAFAIKDFAGAQIALSYRSDIAAKPVRLPCRLPTQRRR